MVIKKVPKTKPKNNNSVSLDLKNFSFCLERSIITKPINPPILKSAFR